MSRATDIRWTRAALSLGRRGQGTVWPNPAVGCIIVREARVVGRGWTPPGGRPHAEVRALHQAGAAARIVRDGRQSRRVAPPHILGERRPFASAGYQPWCDVMQVNVNAQFLLTRCLLPLLSAAPAASVVFTSSGVGRNGRAYWGAYAASKFATEGMMQVLADELENTSQIRVNSLNPGATNTAMRRSAYPGETPTDNPSPAQIMPAYVYLMSDASVGVTGQAINAQ